MRVWCYDDRTRSLSNSCDNSVIDGHQDDNDEPKWTSKKSSTLKVCLLQSTVFLPNTANDTPCFQIQWVPRRNTWDLSNKRMKSLANHQFLLANQFCSSESLALDPNPYPQAKGFVRGSFPVVISLRVYARVRNISLCSTVATHVYGNVMFLPQCFDGSIYTVQGRRYCWNHAVVLACRLACKSRAVMIDLQDSVENAEWEMWEEHASQKGRIPDPGALGKDQTDSVVHSYIPWLR